MLWLAGLMGIVGVGAASLVLPDPAVENEPEEEPVDDVESFEDSDDYFDLLADLYPEESQDDEPLLLDSSFAVPESDYDTSSSSEESGRDVLQNIVRDPLVAGPMGTAGDDFAGFEDDWDDTPENVMLGDWILRGEPAEILDYEAGEDSLMLVWDDLAEGAKEPTVRVEQDPFDSEVMHVVMNDDSVAEVYGDPNLSTADVTVIPLSSALIVGLEPA